jgi:acetamidase/formamidase
MLDWIVALTGISRDEAYALSSFAVDLHVTQTVNNVKGVHAMLDRSILRLALILGFAGGCVRRHTS